ncbi:3-hydroxyacyl-CoA dehydrogenase [Peribacillus kribbensis]|uniref:3-hydroxyacyl-CoA dehydrogenase n=1 Tax=Peribacillus kribbensis TaxID=356658 RepID=UPI00041AAF84|nr:3-hydroxyacyl-CoA dehydrogenase [Peribacillus kribbensis]
MKFAETIALVTGGASGLGEAVVRRIVDKGGRAAILDAARGKGEALKEELGDGALYIQADVRDERQVRAAIGAMMDKWGRLNLAVNCAGIAAGKKVLGKNGIHDLETFSKVIEINLIGTFNVVRLAAEGMARNTPDAEGERGLFVNTASIAAFEGQIGQAAYSASKGGIVSMTLPLARELASVGIRVMAIAPGLFETPMFEALPEPARDALGKAVPFPKRMGRPEEFAGLVEMIAENHMLNGETIRLDGAVRMQPK